MAVRLRRAGRQLSEYKQWMLPEHKTECFEAIQSARESHDAFWAKRRELGEERRRAHERRRSEIEDKKRARQERVHANLSKNREKLSRARSALGRTHDRIREIESKLSETTSDKWIAIFGEWLDKAQTKARDIEESIERLESWIREDEDRLSS